jgi:hypothetical protein
MEVQKYIKPSKFSSHGTHFGEGDGMNSIPKNTSDV